MGTQTVFRTAQKKPAKKETAVKPKNKFLRSIFGESTSTMDYVFLLIVAILVVFGLIMLFSASYAVAIYRFGNSFHFFGSQLMFAALGFTALYVASRVDYHLLRLFAWPLMAVTVILLVVVLFLPATVDGFHRWILIAGVGTIQPSEIAKFAVILLFAHIIAKNHEKMKSKYLGVSFLYGVLPFCAILGAIAVLLLFEPHVSGTVIVLAIGAIMMFVGGTRPIWFGIGAGIGAAGLSTAIVFLKELLPYAMSRINMWMDPFADATDKGHQTIQSLLAVGSGGFMGVGLGNSRQKHLYVPEPQNDFIFSIICEELGFVGACLVIALFAALLLRGVYIAIHAKDRFGTMLVVGIIAQVILQAALNIAVVTNTIPNTGISLPFFSYGGTALMMVLGEMGIVLSVSRQASLQKEEPGTPPGKKAGVKK